MIDDINCENNPDCDDISVAEDLQLLISTVKANIKIEEKYAYFIFPPKFTNWILFIILRNTAKYTTVPTQIDKSNIIKVCHIFKTINIFPTLKTN